MTLLVAHSVAAENGGRVGCRKHKFHSDHSFSPGGNICDTLGCCRYAADLTENREIYIPHVFSTPPRRTPSEFRNILWKLE